jgi:hypothetical protein
MPTKYTVKARLEWDFGNNWNTSLELGTVLNNGTSITLQGKTDFTGGGGWTLQGLNSGYGGTLNFDKNGNFTGVETKIPLDDSKTLGIGVDSNWNVNEIKGTYGGEKYNITGTYNPQTGKIDWKIEQKAPPKDLPTAANENLPGNNLPQKTDYPDGSAPTKESSLTDTPTAQTESPSHDKTDGFDDSILTNTRPDDYTYTENGGADSLPPLDTPDGYGGDLSEFLDTKPDYLGINPDYLDGTNGSPAQAPTDTGGFGDGVLTNTRPDDYTYLDSGATDTSLPPLDTPDGYGGNLSELLETAPDYLETAPDYLGTEQGGLDGSGDFGEGISTGTESDNFGYPTDTSSFFPVETPTVEYPDWAYENNPLGMSAEDVFSFMDEFAPFLQERGDVYSDDVLDWYMGVLNRI